MFLMPTSSFQFSFQFSGKRGKPGKVFQGKDGRKGVQGVIGARGPRGNRGPRGSQGVCEPLDCGSNQASPPLNVSLIMTQ